MNSIADAANAVLEKEILDEFDYSSPSLVSITFSTRCFLFGKPGKRMKVASFYDKTFTKWSEIMQQYVDDSVYQHCITARRLKVEESYFLQC